MTDLTIHNETGTPSATKPGSDTDSRITRFIDHLARLEPGERARFKRNAGTTLAASRNVLTLFYRIIPQNVPTYQHETYFLVATLYPLTDTAKTGSLGNALRLAQDEQNSAGLDRRMERILDADEVQLPFLLRQAAHYLYSQRIGVDWTQLLNDLLRWGHPERYIQRRWATDYFARQNVSSQDSDNSHS